MSDHDLFVPAIDSNPTLNPQHRRVATLAGSNGEFLQSSALDNRDNKSAFSHTISRKDSSKHSFPVLP